MIKKFLLAALFGALSTSTAWAPPWLSYYVSLAGNDAGDCTQPNTPCLHISAATQQALLVGPVPGGVQTINIGAGGWNDSVTVTSHVNRIDFVGAGAATTVWNNIPGQCGTLIANQGANVSISNIEILAVGDSCASSLFAQLEGIINVFGGVVFGPANQQQMHCEGTGSQIEIWNAISTQGAGAKNFIAAISECLVEFNPSPGLTVTFNGSPVYSEAIIDAAVNAVVYVGSTVTWLGSPTGTQYFAHLHGVIFSDGRGCNTLPGSVSGSVDAATYGTCQ